jgi:membrane protease subunit (stomatin/prohibitin family)
MKSALKTFAAIAMIAIPLAASAADTSSQPQSAAPPTGAVGCPCANMMHNGTMQQMHGAMMGNPQGGGMMMVNPTDWQQQQQEIQALRKEVKDLHDQLEKQQKQ